MRKISACKLELTSTTIVFVAHPKKRFPNIGKVGVSKADIWWMENEIFVNFTKKKQMTNRKVGGPDTVLSRKSGVETDGHGYLVETYRIRWTKH